MPLIQTWDNGWKLSLQGAAYVADVKATNVSPASITQGDWRTRELNTELFDSGNFCSLSSNQVTLLPGKYVVLASAPTGSTPSSNQARWRDVTNGVTIAVSTPVFSHASSYYANVVASLIAAFEIGSATVFELQHRVTSTANGGQAVNFGESMVYASALIFKIA